jgi:hypothetical protein
VSTKIPVAIIVVIIALFVVPGVSIAGTPASQPTLSLQRDCSLYPPFHGIDVSLSGFPPNTSFAGTLEFPGGGGAGPAQFTTDVNGNFAIGPFGSEIAGTFTATVVWLGGTLVESLNVNCAVPATKGECKNGGWRTYGVFKNQGDCVSFVATKGKNQPTNGP